MMITLAKPSIAESSPKPTSAIEPASIPATIATTPSTLIAPSDNHESRRTRPASSRYRSGETVATRGDGGATTSGNSIGRLMLWTPDAVTLLGRHQAAASASPCSLVVVRDA